MRTAPKSLRRNEGMASVAVLLFAMVAVFILVANFQLNYAVSMSGDAFDTYNSETVEKNGIAQIVKESILAIGETAAVDSTNPIQTEIQNRLNGMTFPTGVSVALTAASAVPANGFFPFVPSAQALVVAQPDYYTSSATQQSLEGLGGLFSSLASQGPVADLGQGGQTSFTYTFSRSSTLAAGESWTYAVTAYLFAMPLTNIDVVAYGLPASGTIPAQAPVVPPGTFGSGVSTLVLTSNNPGNDTTAYPDLYAPSGTEILPYQYRNSASVAWNAYEFLWGQTYQDALIDTAKTEADPGNQVASTSDPTPAAGAVYDFSLPAYDPSNPGNSPCNPTIAGVSTSGTTLTVDCSAVQSQVIAVVDSEGVGTVDIVGNPASGSPFILLIRNTAGSLGQTQVVFSGDNDQPAIFMLENSNVGFSGDPQIHGALFLDPTTVASGSVGWYGHFSFYGCASPLGTLNIQMNDSPADKTALATLAPRVLLVSTSAQRL